MPTVEDARDVKVTLEQRPQRIVSLVPSVTECVAQLVGPARLVGITKFCTEPQDAVPAIRKVGGTKDPDIEAIAALGPDIVLANQEENREEDVAALEAAGLPVYVGYPRTVRDSVDEVGRIATLLQSGQSRRWTKELEGEVGRQERLNKKRPRVRVFCPIWRRPYMAVGGDTYAGDVLRLAGGENVFESHPLGNRYPQVDLAELATADPEVILLPDEPYRFAKRHREEFLALRSITAAREGRVFLVDGRWLSWYGPRAEEALAGIEALLDRARPDWTAPEREPKKAPAPKRSKGEASKTKNASTKRGAKKASARKKKTAKPPRRDPKTDAGMPPGLKLRVRSQEVVDVCLLRHAEEELCDSAAALAYSCVLPDCRGGAER